MEGKWGIHICREDSSIPKSREWQLIQDFNAILTNSEEDKQFLLQVVKRHRVSYPDSNKSTIVKGLANSPSELANWTDL